MKAAGGPQKLRFTIQSCSGEVRQRTLLLLVAGSAAATAAVARALTSCLIYHRTPITLSGSSCTTAHRREDGSLPGAGQKGNQPAISSLPPACPLLASVLLLLCPTGSASTLRSWCCAWSGRQRCSRFRYWRMSTRWVRDPSSCMQCGLAPQAH